MNETNEEYQFIQFIEPIITYLLDFKCCPVCGGRLDTILVETTIGKIEKLVCADKKTTGCL